MTYTVQIPIDLKLEALSANGRVHWSVRKARTKVLRDKAHVAAVAAHAGPCDYTLKIIPGWSGTSVVGTVVAGAAIGAWLALILAIVIEVTR